MLGRSRDCDIQLNDPNASRRHAELRQEGASYWIVDLDSTNGMEVNGKRVKRAKLTRRRHDHASARPRSPSAVTRMIADSVAVDEVLLVLKIAFLVLLYLFIWRIVRTASRDLRLPQESFILAPGRPQSRARVAARPAHGPARGREEPRLERATGFELNSAQLTIGRGRQNDIPIATDEYASARHARFEPRQDGVWVAGPRLDERDVSQRRRGSTARGDCSPATSSASARPT